MDVMNPETGKRVNVESIEDGGFYRCEGGKLRRAEREDEQGMKRIRITEEAYQKAHDIARAMRKEFKGYKPDLSLVISGLLLYGITDTEQGVQCVKRIAREVYEYPEAVGDNRDGSTETPPPVGG